jgi:hypothetical protein
MDFKEALCVKTPENYWLSESKRDQAQAIVLCARCPILLECAIYTHEVKPSCGVWATKVIGGYVA